MRREHVLGAGGTPSLFCAQTLKPELGQAPSDEHFLLEDNKYIADVLADFRERKTRDTQSKVPGQGFGRLCRVWRARVFEQHASRTCWPTSGSARRATRSPWCRPWGLAGHVGLDAKGS